MTVHYALHPRAGQRLRVWRQVKHPDVTLLCCEIEDGAFESLPAWMVDPVACAGIQHGAPAVEIEALVELRLLLDTQLTDPPLEQIGKQPGVGEAAGSGER